MSGSFRRLRAKLAGRRGPKQVALNAMMACACIARLSPAALAGEVRLQQSAPADRTVLIHEHAGWNGNCEAIAHPALYLFRSPRHGKVCARAQKIKITSMYAGTESQCIGRTVSGVQLVYRPDDAFSGDDVIQYAAQYPSVLRAISVKVTVEAGPPETSSVAQTEVFLPTAQSRQLPGEIPACPQFIF